MKGENRAEFGPLCAATWGKRWLGTATEPAGNQEMGRLYFLYAEVHRVFHAKLHFSDSRVNLWLIEDSFRYRILDIEGLTDPAICLACRSIAMLTRR